jgi:hypothetical protein
MSQDSGFAPSLAEFRCRFTAAIHFRKAKLAGRAVDELWRADKKYFQRSRLGGPCTLSPYLDKAEQDCGQRGNIEYL